MTLIRSGADSYVSAHGDTSYGVEHYDLALTYALRRNHLDARATLTVVAHEPLQRIDLDLQHLHVDKVLVDGRPAKHSHLRGRLSVRLLHELPAGGRVEVVVLYSGNPKPIRKRHLGTAGWEELEDGVIVAGQPHGAPSWFPCNDRPSDKASYFIEVTTSSDYVVVANGELAASTRHGRTTTWAYRQDEPMAPYLATVQIGKYEVQEVDGAPVPTRLVAPRRLRERLDDAFGRQADMIATFEKLFGPYPFSGYTVVVTDDDLEIPLESQSLSTFGANLVRSDWGAVRLVAHELSHQWFGNCLTATSWKDIWLHEGFACYSEWLWSEECGEDTTHERAVAHWEKLSDLPQDLQLSDPGPDLMFDDRVYKRGALCLHALRLTVGDETFFDVLRGWVAEHRNGGVETADFTSFVEARAGGGVRALFRAWLDELELPPLPPRR
ncbi:M1 family peptidase [Nocardioides guangzhouensis]|uniref:Aminopeptidase N n=1 Tax=Nocardioides guangzhouensis TaxID=2497878 RepID=A0A4Q4ZJY6_9ACTN|nr:M1 family metallopeptidase [Nocardioides guangzhouensis]RYP88640.1 M1 family peptidase [Nocardioides guangzhouensis]